MFILGHWRVARERAKTRALTVLVRRQTEAGTLKSSVTLNQGRSLTAEVALPQVTQPGTVHVILQVEDDGTPRLWAYRRAVI